MTRCTPLLLCATLGCGAITTDIGIEVIVPEDSDDLEAADNATVVLAPDGAQRTVTADGLDFALELELDPDDTVRDLELYLAHGETLLAWGRTPSFTYSGVGDGLAVFLGRPGALATFPTLLDLPDDRLLATASPGTGAVLLSTDGATSFLDGFTLEMREADPLIDAPLADDGVLVGDALGGALRVSFSALKASRYDPSDDEWIDLEIHGADPTDVRTGAAWLVDGDAAVLSLFGGGTNTNVIAIDLVPREDGSGIAVGVVEGLALDRTRTGARATWVTREDDDDAEDELVFGTGDDDDIAAGWLVERNVGVGPIGRWTQGGCVQIDPGAGNSDVRVVCGGGVKSGTPTADGVMVRVPKTGVPSAMELPGLLDRAMPEPLWLVDDVAVYAQGEGVLLPIDPATMQAQPAIAALRAGGGQLVPLEGGATLLVGGRDLASVPTTRIQVFTPSVPPT
ncbi:MAG TPA: hypothetical protein VG755_37155 [Nannocystaceae bacterium]|nr:hypothetical protein [Nannocystaceae bacterium]